MSCSTHVRVPQFRNRSYCEREQNTTAQLVVNDADPPRPLLISVENDGKPNLAVNNLRK